MAAYFITGTDTDVGKTVLTSLLLSYFHSEGIDVVPYKPIQSGALIDNGKLTAPDVTMYQRVLPQLDHSRACTYVLRKASSPHLAAREENVKFQIENILGHVEKLKNEHEAVLVEGAGGVIVTIQDDYCMIDLIKDLELPVILVGRAGLGTINHTVLSAMALQSANIPVKAIILNALNSEDEIIERDNVEVIERLTGVPVLGIVPHLHDVDAALLQPLQFHPVFYPLLKKEKIM